MDVRPADHGIISIYKKYTIKIPGRVPGFFMFRIRSKKRPETACKTPAALQHRGIYTRPAGTLEKGQNGPENGFFISGERATNIALAF